MPLRQSLTRRALALALLSVSAAVAGCVVDTPWGSAASVCSGDAPHGRVELSLASPPRLNESLAVRVRVHNEEPDCTVRLGGLALSFRLRMTTSGHPDPPVYGGENWDTTSFLDYGEGLWVPPTGSVELEGADGAWVAPRPARGALLVLHVSVQDASWNESWAWNGSLPVDLRSAPAREDPGGLKTEDAPDASPRGEPEFAPLMDPPTRDPPTPYAFDPALLVNLRRDANGTLVRDENNGAGYDENGTWVVFPPRPQEPPPPCEPRTDKRPTVYTDANQNRVFDDVEAHLAGLPPGSRIHAIVGFDCGLTWNDVLAMREAHGDFRVNSLSGWPSAHMTAELTLEQAIAIATRPDVQSVGGNHVFRL